MPDTCWAHQSLQATYNSMQSWKLHLVHRYIANWPSTATMCWRGVVTWNTRRRIMLDPISWWPKIQIIILLFLLNVSSIWIALAHGIGIYYVARSSRNNLVCRIYYQFGQNDLVGLTNIAARSSRKRINLYDLCLHTVIKSLQISRSQCNKAQANYIGTVNKLRCCFEAKQSD